MGQASIIAGIYVYGALYLAGVMALGVLWGEPGAAKFALVASGFAYLAQNFIAGGSEAGAAPIWSIAAGGAVLISLVTAVIGGLVLVF